MVDPEIDRRTAAELRTVVDDLSQEAKRHDKESFVLLLREKRFEEALTVLYRLREHAPDNGSVARGIQHLKQRVLEGYLAQLGDLDRVPSRGPRAADGLAPEAAALLRLVDGISCLGDLLESSRLGRLPTARLLVQLVDSGCAVLGSPAPQLRLVPAPPPSAPRPAPVEPPRAPVADFALIFRQATAHYLSREYDDALRLFRRCLELHPDDRRTLHNIERLEKRERGL